MAIARIKNDLFERELELERLAMAIARNQVGNKLPLKDVLEADMISIEFAEMAFKDPLFVTKTKRYAKDLVENGFSFKEKARIIAEDGLLIAHKILHDNVAPANVRLKALENLVEWSDLAPKDTTPVNLNQAGPAFSINIMLDQGKNVQAISAHETIVTATVPTAPAPKKSFQLIFPSGEEDSDAYDN